MYIRYIDRLNIKLKLDKQGIENFSMYLALIVTNWFDFCSSKELTQILCNW